MNMFQSQPGRRVTPGFAALISRRFLSTAGTLGQGLQLEVSERPQKAYRTPTGSIPNTLAYLGEAGVFRRGESANLSIRRAEWAYILVGDSQRGSTSSNHLL